MATKFVSLERLTTFKDKIIKLLNNKLDKSGGTMTGNLKVGSSNIGTNGYIEGTWLKSTQASNKGSNTGKVAVFDDSGWLYYRTPAQIVDEAGVQAGATVANYTAKTSTSWTKSSDYFYQDVTVTGITASDTPIVGLVPTMAGHDDEWSAWNSVFKITTATNKLRLYSDEAIDIALSLQIKVVK